MLVVACLAWAAGLGLGCQSQGWRRQPRVYLNQREVLAPTAHSFSLIVDSTDEMVSRTILDEGTWQPHILTLISNLVKQGDTVLNLGAQTGIEAVLIGKIVGSKGKLHIFEPYSVSYKMLVKNLYLNSLEGWSRAYKMAAGLERRQMKLWIDGENTGHSNLFQKNSVGEFEEIEVDAVDSVIGESSIDFALIDVEMYEVHALLGMASILNGSPSLVVVVEWTYLGNSKRDEALTRELLGNLERIGYRWYRYLLLEDPCRLGSLQPLPYAQLLAIKSEDLLLAAQHADLSRFVISS